MFEETVENFPTKKKKKAFDFKKPNEFWTGKSEVKSTFREIRVRL